MVENNGPGERRPGCKAKEKSVFRTGVPASLFISAVSAQPQLVSLPAKNSNRIGQADCVGKNGIFAKQNTPLKLEPMEITDIFKIPLFRNFTLKMQEEFLDKLEYTVEEHPKGKTIIYQGTTCNALHILLKGKLNVDVQDVSGNNVRVETIQAPRTFATPHIFSDKNLFPATFTVEEEVVLIKASKESVFALMHSMPLFLHNFLCVSTGCNKCTMTRLRVLSFRGIRSRFIYYLFEHQKKDSDLVEMEHTQEQLAEYFGVTRPALSKEIRKLAEEGFISVSRGKVRILNKAALACML